MQWGNLCNSVAAKNVKGEHRVYKAGAIGRQLTSCHFASHVPHATDATKNSNYWQYAARMESRRQRSQRLLSWWFVYPHGAMRSSNKGILWQMLFKNSWIPESERVVAINLRSYFLHKLPTVKLDVGFRIRFSASSTTRTLTTNTMGFPIPLRVQVRSDLQQFSFYITKFLDFSLNKKSSSHSKGNFVTSSPILIVEHLCSSAFQSGD